MTRPPGGGAAPGLSTSNAAGANSHRPLAHHLGNAAGPVPRSFRGWAFRKIYEPGVDASWARCRKTALPYAPEELQRMVLRNAGGAGVGRRGSSKGGGGVSEQYNALRSAHQRALVDGLLEWVVGEERNPGAEWSLACIEQDVHDFVRKGQGRRREVREMRVILKRSPRRGMETAGGGRSDGLPGEVIDFDNPRVDRHVGTQPLHGMGGGGGSGAAGGMLGGGGGMAGMGAHGGPQGGGGGGGGARMNPAGAGMSMNPGGNAMGGGMNPGGGHAMGGGMNAAGGHGGGGLGMGGGMNMNPQQQRPAGGHGMGPGMPPPPPPPAGHHGGGGSGMPPPPPPPPVNGQFGPGARPPSRGAGGAMGAGGFGDGHGGNMAGPGGKGGKAQKQPKQPPVQVVNVDDFDGIEGDFDDLDAIFKPQKGMKKQDYPIPPPPLAQAGLGKEPKAGKQPKAGDHELPRQPSIHNINIINPPNKGARDKKASRPHRHHDRYYSSSSDDELRYTPRPSSDEDDEWYSTPSSSISSGSPPPHFYGYPHVYGHQRRSRSKSKPHRFPPVRAHREHRKPSPQAPPPRGILRGPHQYPLLRDTDDEYYPDGGYDVMDVPRGFSARDAERQFHALRGARGVREDREYLAYTHSPPRRALYERSRSRGRAVPPAAPEFPDAYDTPWRRPAGYAARSREDELYEREREALAELDMIAREQKLNTLEATMEGFRGGGRRRRR